MVARGVTHEAVEAAVLGGVMLVAAAVNVATGGWLLEVVGLPTATAFVAGFLAGSLLLSPDLDMASYQSVLAKRRWGVLRGLWIPYGLLFKHRGVSHSYVIGPASRLGYLALWVWGALWVVRRLGFELWWVGLGGLALWPWQRLVVAAVVGVVLANWSHLMTDGVYPFEVQRRARRRGW